MQAEGAELRLGVSSGEWWREPGRGKKRNPSRAYLSSHPIYRFICQSLHLGCIKSIILRTAHVWPYSACPTSTSRPRPSLLAVGLSRQWLKLLDQHGNLLLQHNNASLTICGRGSSSGELMPGHNRSIQQKLRSVPTQQGTLSR